MTIDPRERSSGPTDRSQTSPDQRPADPSASSQRLRRAPTLRRRILWIAWGPSLALLIVGGVIATSLAVQSANIKSVARVLSNNGGASGKRAAQFVPSMTLELDASAQVLTDPSHADTNTLTQRRAIVNEDLQAFLQAASKVKLNYTSPAFAQTLGQFQAQLGQLQATRQGIDKGTVSLLQASQYYGNVIRLTGVTEALIGATGPDGQSSLAESLAGRLFEITSQAAQGNALAHAAFAGPGMTDAEYQAFVMSAGTYRTTLQQFQGQLAPNVQAEMQRLVKSPAWRQQLAVEQAAMAAKVPTPKPSSSTDLTSPDPATSASTGTSTTADSTTADSNGADSNSAVTDSNGDGTSSTAGTGSTDSTGSTTSTQAAGLKAKLPITRATWSNSASQVMQALGQLDSDQTIYGGTLAGNVSQKRITQAILVGGLLLLFALIVLLLTTREFSKIVSRLRRLQAESLDLASNRLPRMVARLREGDRVEESEELAPISLGRDEIGQVADAFNFSQRVAVGAAIREAETRAGLRMVFLNIAYRSQVIVHRQLNVLERAERFQEDPEQLKLLFELDHLSTRARRNAENLVILGGGQPGRQWRNSVALLQVVRGAISEAEDYARVSIGDLPQVSVGGAAVADVIHLLAEVVDNATSFSPPMSRVEVRGNMVGRGLVLEIEDQGLGIPTEQLEQLNEMMQEPPEFHVMALREEPRLGMFVVAQLAQTHGIRVTLTPSPAYGGTRVVVLLPNNLLDSGGQPAALPPRDEYAMEPEEEPMPTPMPAPPLHSMHDRMAFEGDVLAGNTGEFTMPPRWDQPRTPLEEPFQRQPLSHSQPPPQSQPIRRPPILSVAPNGNGSNGNGSSANYETAPRPVVSATPSSRPGRPDLPRRSRQSHLSERLRTSSLDREMPAAQMEPEASDPDLARNRMAAFQRGTQRGRIETPDGPA